MDTRAPYCEHCGALLPGKTRGRPQRFCSDAHRQAHRKIASAPEKGPRYRTGRLKPKVASQDSDLAREFEPEKLSEKSLLRFERVNEITFKLTDGELTTVPASHGQWGGYRTTKVVASVINVASGSGWHDAKTRSPDLPPSMRLRRMLSQWRGALMATTSSRIQSTTLTDCKLACSTAMGGRSDGSSDRIQKLGRS